MDEKRVASALRLSPHYYNTEHEIERVVEELRRVAARSIAAS
jgi:selenocysteine lyase/cysteine desulfurase